jgi:glucose/arabinose dehydrogenase
MGVDHLGKDKPNDMFYNVFPGTNYGWPYCYEYDGKVYDDTTIQWKHKNLTCEIVPPADAEFPAHSAPLGLEYIEEFRDLNINNSFLVALHGSSDVALGTGYKIVRK